jgi:hypothetical protein
MEMSELSESTVMQISSMTNFIDDDIALESSRQPSARKTALTAK